MSNNFEILKQIEKDRFAVRSTGFSTSARSPIGKLSVVSGTAAEREMLGLVQTVFLSASGPTPLRHVVFAGVDDRNGSSRVCESAGRLLAAHSGKSVCLVDANVRSPRLATICGAYDSSKSYIKALSIREQCIEVRDNLWLAKSDLLRDKVGGLIAPDEMEHRIEQLQSAFDFLIVDAPGCALSGDVILLGRNSDGVILVVEANDTRKLAARRAKENLAAAGVPILGAVLRDRIFPIPEPLYKRL